MVRLPNIVTFPSMIYFVSYKKLKIKNYLVFNVGVIMDFISDLFSNFGNLNYEVIFQLVSVSLILIAGPVIVFILFAIRGDL